MIYPDFIKKRETIGICALSAGIGKKLAEYEESIAVLNKEGYNIKETASVRINSPRSNTGNKRAKELDELINDEDVKMIIEATGGDYQSETLPYINFENIRRHPKWIMGYSDPTNLLFPVTTGLDIATLYGFNGASYTKENKLDQLNNLNIIKGKLVKQESFEKCQSFIDIINDNEVYEDVYWKSSGPVKQSGRCIGGCLDVITKLIGTKYDHISEFIERYKDDGIIWYFDIFALSSLDTYLSLLQMEYAGYFKYAKAVIIGRIAFPRVDSKELDYKKAYKLALKKIPYVYESDIGHTKPRITMINGAMMDLDVKDGKGSIEFKLI